MRDSVAIDAGLLRSCATTHIADPHSGALFGFLARELLAEVAPLMRELSCA